MCACVCVGWRRFDIYCRCSMCVHVCVWGGGGLIRFVGSVCVCMCVCGGGGGAVYAVICG